MAVSLFASGTQTATIGTEHFLSSPNQSGVYTLHVDTVNMALGDTLVLRVYQIVLTGGTSRVAYVVTYQDAQPTDDLIKVSLPIGNDLAETNALRFSLTQTTGTGRQYPWKVLRYT
ncbi:MAG: hypothetical protein QXU32_13215 [Nitrososphaerales archaeon]